MFEVDDDTLCLAAATNPRFISLNLKGRVNLSPGAIRRALASRGKGLLSLDLSNGVRSCGDILKPLNFKPSKTQQMMMSGRVETLNHQSSSSPRTSEEEEEANQTMDEKVNLALSSLVSLSLNRCPGFATSWLSFIALRCTVYF
jgi:hypothetical protein